MYRLMNDCCDAILAELDRISDVPRYLELRRQMSRVNVSTDAAFQRKYRAYWRMNVTQLGAGFYSQYFMRLETWKRRDRRCQRGDSRDRGVVGHHGTTVLRFRLPPSS